jgi:membrane protease YdiL (CAAX protease family)
MASKLVGRLVESGLRTAQLSNSSPARDFFEIVLAYGLIVAVIWTPNPLQRVLYWTAFVAIILITLLRREDLTTLGLGRQGVAPSLWVVGFAFALAAITVGAGYCLHTLHSLSGHAPLFAHVWGYFIWAIMQQFLLQSYFLARCLRLTSNRWLAVLSVALLFAIAHIPNPVLMIATFVWGFCCSLLFLRYRNVYTIGIAHGILGMCFAITVPDRLHHHMRVGSGYLHYHQRLSARPHS